MKYKKAMMPIKICTKRNNMKETIKEKDTNKKIIIVGNNNFADLMRYYWETDAKRQVAAYTVENQYITEEIHDGLPVIALESLEDKYPPQQYSLSLCIGYSKMNSLRERLFHMCLDKGYEIENFIHSTVKLEEDTKLGCGNILLKNVLIEPFCEIGDANFFFAGSLISHNARIQNYNFFGGNSVLAGFVTVKNNCFVGVNATIKNNIDIPSFVLVGAGTYLSENPKEYDVVVPEKSIVLPDKRSIDLI